MRFILLLAAAAIAVFAGVAALQLSGGKPPPAPAVAAANSSPDIKTVDVLVAKNPIAVGTVIKESLVDKQPWPEHLVLKGFIVGDSKPVIGKIARSAIQAREPITAGKLSGSNEAGFLAAGLPAGMRALTIATDAVSGVAGYVFPGDRVDILFTHNIPGRLSSLTSPEGADTDSKRAIAEVLVPNALVLAVNVRTGNDGESSAAPSSITLSLNETDTQKVALAERAGTLSLALRSVQDRQSDVGAPDPALLGQLTRAGGGTVDTGGVKVIRGAGGRPSVTPVTPY